MPKRSVNIITDLSIHTAIILEISLFVYYKFGDSFYTFMAFLGGLFIDSDHIIDFFIYLRKKGPGQAGRFSYRRAERIYLIFHSWELVAIAAVLSFFSAAKAWQIFTFSWGMHLLVDNIDGIKKKGLFSYFLLYRVARGFEARKLKGLIFGPRL